MRCTFHLLLLILPVMLFLSTGVFGSSEDSDAPSSTSASVEKPVSDAENEEGNDKKKKDPIFHAEARVGTALAGTAQHGSRMRFGFLGGLGATRYIKPFLSINTMVMFNQQMINIMNTDTLTYSRFRSDTITIPLTARYHYDYKMLKLFAALGPLAILSMQSSLEVPVEGNFSMKEQVNQFNMGFNLEGGTEIHTKAGVFVASMGVYANFIETIKPEAFDHSIRVSQIYITAGYQYPIIIPDRPDPVPVQPPQPPPPPPPPPKEYPTPTIHLGQTEVEFGGPDFTAIEIKLEPIDLTESKQIKVYIKDESGETIQMYTSATKDVYYWDGNDMYGRWVNISEPTNFTIEGTIVYPDSEEPRTLEPVTLAIHPYVYPIPEISPSLRIQNDMFSPDKDQQRDSAVIIVKDLDSAAVNFIELTITDKYGNVVKTFHRDSAETVFIWQGDTVPEFAIQSYATYTISGVVGYKGHEDTHSMEPVELRTGPALVEYETDSREGFFIRSEGFTFTNTNELTPESQVLLDLAFEYIIKEEIKNILITIYFTEEEIYSAYEKVESLESYFLEKELPDVQVISGVYPKNRRPEFSYIETTLIEINIFSTK